MTSLSQAVDFDDFEKVVLAYALTYGRVESGNVSIQMQEILKLKGEANVTYYDAFQRATTKLRQKGLFDDKNRPTAQATEAVGPQVLRSSLLQAHRRIGELEAEMTRKENELSQARIQAHSLEGQLRAAQSQIDRMSPPTQFISKEALQKGLGQFVGYDLLTRVSDVAKSDLEGAMKCIFHAIPTPAAMVSLRASEEAVRRYYQFKTGKEPGKMSWKDILDSLVQREDVNKTLVGHLNYIREKRNEAEHPQKIFDQFEAENTFQTVISAIREIYGEMTKASPHGKGNNDRRIATHP